MEKYPWVLPLIVCSQFMGTSLWFAGNAVMPGLVSSLGLAESDLGYVTSSVQLGFISGTLFYAFFTIPDRYKPSTVFFISSLLGALSNALIVLDSLNLLGVLLLRFFTGFFLAGIYPVGMKIAADYYEKGLGKALSFLVGALVLGTALPHLIASFETSLSWKIVIYATTGLAVLGGMMVQVFIGPGPYCKSGQRLRIRAILSIFKNQQFRSASFGYFGHMWELYAFWAFVPIVLGTLLPEGANVSFLSFLVIGLGSAACLFGGLLSVRMDMKRLAGIALGLSGLCCVFSPLAFDSSGGIVTAFLVFWGLMVIADSPLFSALVAHHSESEIKGTALTIVTSIGFAISILSIQLTSALIPLVSIEYVFLPLSLGPILGLLALFRKA